MWVCLETFKGIPVLTKQYVASYNFFNKNHYPNKLIKLTGMKN